MKRIMYNEARSDRIYQLVLVIVMNGFVNFLFCLYFFFMHSFSLLLSGFSFRGYLVKPLLQVLSNLFSDNGVKGYFGEIETETRNVDEELFSSILYQARQLALIVLKDIMDLLEHNLPQVISIFFSLFSHLKIIKPSNKL